MANLTDADKVLRNDTGKDIVTALSKMSTLNTKQITNTPIASFTDGADNIPVKSLVSEIVAVESGSGEKSPDNPYTISGFDIGVVSVCGKNLANFTDGYGISTSGEIVSNVKRTSTVTPIKIDNTKTYVFTFTGSNIVGAYAVWNNNTLVRRITGFGGGVIDVSGGNLVYLSCYNSAESSSTPPTTKADCTPQLELGTTATTYEAYNGNTYTFAFGQTVYGGHFDNKGNLVITSQIIDLGDLTWSSTAGNMFLATLSGVKNVDAYSIPNSLCTIYNPTSWNTGTTQTTLDHIYCFLPNYNQLRLRDSTYSDASAFTSAVTGQKLVYELANPITLAITSQNIPTLSGENNIFSNCGDINTLVYYPQGQDAVVSLNSIANSVLGIADVLTEGLDNIAESVVPRAATEIPIESGSATNTKDYIDSGLSGKEDILSTISGTITANTSGGWGFMVG